MKTIFITDSERIESILKKGQVCFVAMIDNEGDPYVIPMNYAYVKGVFYLHSGAEGGKIGFLKQNPKVAISVNVGEQLTYQHVDVACSYSMRGDSVVARGTVEFIENIEEKTEIMNYMMYHYTKRNFEYSLPAITNVKVWRVVPVSITCKSFGNSFKEIQQQ